MYINKFQLSVEYWKKRKAQFNFCKRTRAEKLHFCRAVLGSDTFNNLSIDGSSSDPAVCEKRKFLFHGGNSAQLAETDGKQTLKMFPCIVDTKPKKLRYFLTGGDKEKDPSLYLFYEDRSTEEHEGSNKRKEPFPIYFEAKIKITPQDINQLVEVRATEKKRQQEIYRQSLVAKVDGSAHEGPLIPL